MTTGIALVMEEQHWGPKALGDGRFRFQLWAPAAGSVGLRLNGVTAPMTQSDGWFRLDMAARAGDAYAFVLEDGRVVADPASRQQAGVLDGPSVVIDPDAHTWQNLDWTGRPWEEAIFYEIHIGTFTAEGTFRAAAARLKHLAELGITAVEVMPIAHFPGARGWGYDGVLQFAPHTAYGTPEDVKAFVDNAHGLGLMVFLDLVYNHFGPEGNYLGHYAPGFFRQDISTPWGSAIDYEKPEVRAFFIENVLYWLREFRFDGVRLDAVDQIDDGSDVHILEEIARTVRDVIHGRHVHLIVENPSNGTDLMADAPGGPLYKADWNDEFHHAMRVAITGETGGFLQLYKDQTWDKIRHVMAHGYFTEGKPIVSTDPPPTESLPPMAFVHFLQNHDQIGNRALGDRLHLGIDRHVYRAMTEMLLLSPQIPLLFMGDDHLSMQPFHFFADYEGDLAIAIRDNRPREAENFGGFPEGFSAADIPDPNAKKTFLQSKLDWNQAETEGGKAWSRHLQRLTALRREKILPLLADAGGYSGTVVEAPEKCLFIDWTFGDRTLQLRANFGEQDVALPTGLGERIFPEAGIEPGRLDTATVQLFIR